MALSVSVPLLIYMAIGALVRKRGIFSREQFVSLNGLSYHTFLPVLLFKNVYSADISDVMHPSLFLFVTIYTISACAISFLVSHAVTKSLVDRATVAQGCFRSNYLLFGTIMAQALCDERGMALLSALAAVAVPLNNILSAFLFETCRGGKMKPSHLLLAIIRNPSVIAGFLGIFFSLTGLRLPDLLMSPINGLSNAATPVALVSLGGVLSFDSMKADKLLLAFTTVARLVVIPLIAVFICIRGLHFSGNELVAILAVCSSPTAVASAPSAQVMGGNGPLASEIVAVTSAFCIITIYLFVFTLSSMGYL